MKAFYSEKSCKDCKNTGCVDQNLKPEERDLLSQNKMLISFSAGEIIQKQGTLSDYLYFLNQGVVKITVSGENKRNVLLRILAPNRFIGLASLCVHESSPISIIALTDCTICQIRKTCIQMVLQNNDQFKQTIAQAISDEFTLLYNKVINFGTSNNHGRLASSLLYLDSTEFQQVDLYHLISRKELAELSAISLESMNKILKEFKNDRIIEVTDKHIKLLQPELLEHICWAG